MVLSLDSYTGKPASEVYKQLDHILFDRMRLKEVTGVNPILDLALYTLATASPDSLKAFASVVNVDALLKDLEETCLNRANYFQFFKDLDED